MANKSILVELEAGTMARRVGVSKQALEGDLTELL